MLTHWVHILHPMWSLGVVLLLWWELRYCCTPPPPQPVPWHTPGAVRINDRYYRREDVLNDKGELDINKVSRIPDARTWKILTDKDGNRTVYTYVAQLERGGPYIWGIIHDHTESFGPFHIALANLVSTLLTLLLQSHPKWAPVIIGAEIVALAVAIWLHLTRRRKSVGTPDKPARDENP